MNTNQQPEPSPSPLAEQVMERIKAKQVTPTSRWVFFGHRCVMRVLFLLSVVVGAVAVAVSVFSLLHTRYALYEATHESWYAFMMESVPLLWLGLLVMMGVLSVYQFRHTDRGYRYSLPVVIGTSVGLSLLGGVLLYVVGAGSVVDKQMEDLLPSMYRSQEQRELNWWMLPEEGRLVGRVESAAATTTVVVIRDVAGQLWWVETMDLQPADNELLRRGEKVRLLGFPVVPSDELFHLCGVFPWMYEGVVTLNKMAQERQSFIERMYALHERTESQAEALEELLEERVDNKMGRCAELPVVHRVSTLVP